jgi:N-acetylglucosaminyl-diphospho-decaprenol L-rhamnosyltransferase
MRDPRRPVTVSIVSHGHWVLIEPLLRQLSNFSAESIERVVLTLNVPERVRIADNLAFVVEVVPNPRPRGFAANHNAAFGRTSTPWFLVMNPDLRINRDLVGTLLACAQDEAGLLSPRVQEPGRQQPEPYRELVTPLELIRRRQQKHEPPAFPSWIAGMFMLIRTAAYAEVRGFDERFFMYCEDVDLCVRLQLAGWKLQVATDLVVQHDARRHSHSSVRALVWHITSFVKLWTSQGFWQYVRLRRRWAKRSSPPTVSLCDSQPAREQEQRPHA